MSKLTSCLLFWINFCGIGNACEYSRHPNCHSQPNKYGHGKLFWKSITVATQLGIAMGIFNFLEIHHQKLIANSGVHCKQNLKKMQMQLIHCEFQTFLYDDFVSGPIRNVKRLFWQYHINKGSTVQEAARPQSR